MLLRRNSLLFESTTSWNVRNHETLGCDRLIKYSSISRLYHLGKWTTWCYHLEIQPSVLWEIALISKNKWLQVFLNVPIHKGPVIMSSTWHRHYRCQCKLCQANCPFPDKQRSFSYVVPIEGNNSCYFAYTKLASLGWITKLPYLWYSCWYQIWTKNIYCQ